MTAARRVRLTPPDEPLEVTDGRVVLADGGSVHVKALLAAGWTVTEVEPPTRAEQIEAAARALVMARGVRWPDALAPLSDALDLPADPEPTPTLPAIPDGWPAA